MDSHPRWGRFVVKIGSGALRITSGLLDAALEHHSGDAFDFLAATPLGDRIPASFESDYECEIIALVLRDPDNDVDVRLDRLSTSDNGE